MRLTRKAFVEWLKEAPCADAGRCGYCPLETWADRKFCVFDGPKWMAEFADRVDGNPFNCEHGAWRITRAQALKILSGIK